MISEPVTCPQRIWIVGVSGSGKTTLAREVAQILGVEHLELDAVFWQENWTFRAIEVAQQTIVAFCEQNPQGWVMDGNWTNRLDGMLTPGQPGRADIMVWLDHPRYVTMTRLITRTLARGITKKPLWHGNTERIRGWFSTNPDNNIVIFAWRQHKTLRDRWSPVAATEPWVIRLRGQRQVKQWLATLN